jgi:hypothetical protein
VYLGKLVVVCPVGNGAEDGWLGGQGQEVIILGLLVRLLVVPYLGQQIVFSLKNPQNANICEKNPRNYSFWSFAKSHKHFVQAAGCLVPGTRAAIKSSYLK